MELLIKISNSKLIYVNEVTTEGISQVIRHTCLADGTVLLSLQHRDDTAR